MTEHKPRIVIVAGPTASGKTSLGMELAEWAGGEIVSADSVQIYRYMDVGSAKPGPAERARIAHHMIDIRYPNEEFTAGEYVREARQSIAEILRKGKTPFVVGGTGLYIRLLLGGIAPFPEPDYRLRAKLRNEEGGRPGTLFDRLSRVDPDAARNAGKENLVRIIRALEIFELTGERISRLQKEHAFTDRPYDYLFLCLGPERKVLYERIDTRVDSMIEGGLWDEVSNLYKLGYTRELRSMNSLGYRHAGMLLAGEIGADEAVRLLKRDTRRYAKRQVTWFRSEPEAVWCDPDRREGIRLMVTHFLGK
jgi:tRNA dimethylallyltransferase